MHKLLITICLLLVCSTSWAKNFCLDANAVGCWLFTEGSGTTADDATANSNTGNFKGAGEPAWDTSDVSFSVSGTAPNSVDFDVTDDYISVTADASINNLANFTIIGWARKEGAGGGSLGRVFEKTGKYTIVSDDGDLYIGIDTSGTKRDSLSAVDLFTANTWVHFAITYASGTAPKIYKSGQEVTSYEYQNNGTGTDVLDAANNLFIGNRSDGTRSFNGKMTDIGLFSRVLSQGEILKIMNHGLNGRRVF